jgi:hypothetical protein
MNFRRAGRHKYSGLKGRAMIAQGEALGFRSTNEAIALKGRAWLSSHACSAPSGLQINNRTTTQGFALGYHGAARWA